ncbi:MAG: dephospho-CoA kinase [Alphaproteobacteria bacterium]|nr:dephospho-CoA kinase [Alphaproteobacteria bacterium]
MLLIGLTGSIGMGKSTVAQCFAAESVPCYEADEAVHRLYQQGGAAVAPVAKLFPTAIKNNAVDRGSLSKLILKDKAALQQLEAIIHPLVRADRLAFLQQQAQQEKADKGKTHKVVLDIPLLFEVGAQDEVDVTIVVSAPAEIQKKRVLARPAMTEEKFIAICKRQMPDIEKCRLADFVIDNGGTIAQTHKQVQTILKKLEDWPQRKWHMLLAKEAE